MRAQLFIVGIVFIAGTLSAVQAGLLAYSMIDVSSPLSDNDAYLLKNVKEVINKTVTEELSCTEMNTDLNQLKHFLSDLAKPLEYSVDISFLVDCAKWNSYPPSDPPVRVSLQVKSRTVTPKTETSEYLDIYNTVGIYP